MQVRALGFSAWPAMACLNFRDSELKHNVIHTRTHTHTESRHTRSFVQDCRCRFTDEVLTQDWHSIIQTFRHWHSGLVLQRVECVCTREQGRDFTFSKENVTGAFQLQCWNVVGGCQCVALRWLNYSECLSVCCYAVSGRFWLV